MGGRPQAGAKGRWWAAGYWCFFRHCIPAGSLSAGTMKTVLRGPSAVLFSAEEIAGRIDGLVEEIAAGEGSDNLVLLGVLKGSFMFFADLVRRLDEHRLHPRIDFLALESYSGTESTGVVRIIKDVRVDVRGADVLLVDDILDTGRTLQFARGHLHNKGARRVRTCVLLDKPARRDADIQADYRGFEIEDRFVIGYGLDYENRYRELPYIAEYGEVSAEGG